MLRGDIESNLSVSLRHKQKFGECWKYDESVASNLWKLK